MKENLTTKSRWHIVYFIPKISPPLVHDPLLWSVCNWQEPAGTSSVVHPPTSNTKNLSHPSCDCVKPLVNRAKNCSTLAVFVVARKRVNQLSGWSIRKKSRIKVGVVRSLLLLNWSKEKKEQHQKNRELWAL